MRGAALFFATVCGMPLAGCSGMLGPQPIPEWAMSRQSVTQEGPAKKRIRIAIVRPAGTLPARSARSPGLASRASSMSDGRLSLDSDASLHYVRARPDVSPFTKEWYAREEGIDARLRRQLHICTGC
jgi:hypothetical protein